MARTSAAVRHARPRQVWTRQTQDAYRNNALAADSAERNQVPLDFTWAGDARNLKAMNPTVEANSARLLGTPEQAVEQSHAELRRQREWFRTTLASIGDAVIATDADARVTFLNPAAEALTGWSSAEAIGQPVQAVFRVLNEQTHQPLEDLVARVLREQRVVTLANHSALVARDGREIPIEDSAAPIQDGTGHISGVVLVFHDVSEKRRAQEALRALNDQLEHRVQDRTAEVRQSLELVRTEQQRFRGALDQLPAYLVLLSPDYYVPFANRFFEERFGKSEGRRCYEYLFERTEPCENCESFKVLKTRAPHRWEWTGPDGRNYDISDFPFTDVDGSPLVMEVGLDVTDRKATETELAKHREHLEDLVRHRSGELAAANAQLQAEVAERTRAAEELRARNQELVRFNHAMVDRELRMIALKREVNELCACAGRPPRYPLDFEKDPPR